MMMDSLQFINAIKYREQFEKTAVSDIYSLLKHYPFFQTAHLLLLKKLHDIKSPEFSNRLGLSAIHVVDRSILYNLIHYDRFIDAASASSKQPDVSGQDELQTQNDKAKVDHHEVATKHDKEKGEKGSAIEKKSTTENIAGNMEEKEKNIGIEDIPGEEVNSGDLMDKFSLIDKFIQEEP
ncbi:MAG: hypothetical protein RQ866_03135, partial [Bacteroidales bacterium]|nr:hypothetical protein [Bacteroidales bacterium]